MQDVVLLLALAFGSEPSLGLARIKRAKASLPCRARIEQNPRERDSMLTVDILSNEY
jgi:hypothetical protein